MQLPDRWDLCQGPDTPSTSLVPVFHGSRILQPKKDMMRQGRSLFLAAQGYAHDFAAQGHTCYGRTGTKGRRSPR